MPNASDAVWLSVLPDMSGFGGSLIKGVGKQTEKPGRQAGKMFGRAMLAGIGAVVAAGGALYKIGSTFDDLRVNISSNTGAMGSDLEALVGSAKTVAANVPASFEDVGDAIAALNSATGATGPVLEGLTSKVLEASRVLGEDGTANAEAFGRSLNQWGVPAAEGEQKLDALFAATQKYGTSLDSTIGNLNAYGSILQNAGFTMEESAALFGQLEKSGLGVSRVMPGLNMAFRKWSEEGKNSQEELGRTIEAMKNAESSTEALAIATDAFGAEGAQRLTTAVRSGSLALGDLTGALEGSDGAVAAASEQATGFAEEWQMFRNEIMNYVEPAATRLFGVISDGMKWIRNVGIPAIKEMGQWIQKNSDWLVPLAAGIGGVVAAINAWILVQKIRRGVTLAAAAAQRVLNAVMRANPIGIVITILTGLVAAFVAAYKKSETFRNIVDGVWSAVKTAFQVAWAFIRDKIFAPIVSWFGSLGDTFRLLKDGLIAAWNAVKLGFKKGWDFIKNVVLLPFRLYFLAWKKIITTAIDLVVAAWNGIKSAFKAAWDWIKRQVIDRFVQGLRVWRGLIIGAVDKVKATWDTIKGAFSAVWTWVKTRVIAVFEAAINVWKNKIRSAVNRVKSIWNGIKSVFKTVYDWVRRNVIDRFKDTFDGLVSKVRKIKDKLGDVWRGIANKFRNPINWVIRVVWNDGIAGAFNKAASAIGIDTRLPDAVQIPAFARGGRHDGGWALVGEEGPELVNFSQPGRVYTADQTRDAVAGSPASKVPAVGGIWESITSTVSSAASTVGGWIRGGLASAAGLILNPLKSLISSTVGQWGTFGAMGGDVFSSVIDRVLKWISGKDDEVADGAPLSKGGWTRPTRGPVTSEFGSRWGAFHAGIDVAGGGPTYAARAGTVAKTGWNIGPGRTGIGILLNHGGGVYTYYGHNPPGGVAVSPGQSVQAGQRIGRQGATGNVTGTHLHFEYHPSGAWGAVNPRRLGLFDGGGFLDPGMAAFHSPSMSKPDAVLTDSQWRDVSELASRGGFSADDMLAAVREGARLGTEQGVSSGFAGGSADLRGLSRMGGF